jgi:hypothetical protein
VEDKTVIILSLQTRGKMEPAVLSADLASLPENGGFSDLHV